MQWLIESAEQQSAKLKDGLSPENALERFASLLLLLAQLLAALRHVGSSSNPAAPTPPPASPHESRLTIDG